MKEAVSKGLLLRQPPLFDDLSLSMCCLLCSWSVLSRLGLNWKLICEGARIMQEWF